MGNKMDKFLDIIFRLGWILIWLFLGFMISRLLDFPLTMEFEREYPAIVYQTNNLSFIKKTNIKIKGNLTERIFSGPEFEGQIEFYNAETEEIQEYDLWFKKTTNANRMSGQIQKMNPTLTTELQFPDVVCTIFLSRDMKNIAINLNNTQIAGPTSTKEEAIKIYHDIFNID